MTLEECYVALHGNYAEALMRLAKDELVERFILKFPDDPTMDQLREAVAARDIEASFLAAHTLKGVAANLAFSNLQAAASDLTEQLRPRTAPADPALVAAVETAYEAAIGAIEAYAADKP